MKKTLISIALFFLSASLFAQMKVISSGSVYLSYGNSYWINSTSDNGIRLRLHNNNISSYIDFYPDIYFRTSYSANGLSNTPLYIRYGRVGINNTDPQCTLDVSGVIQMNGVAVSSDERLKENISTVTGALSTLSLLRGVSYKLKPLKANSSVLGLKTLAKSDSGSYARTELHGLDSVFYSRNHIGFLAQEIQTVYPELVYSNKDGMLSVDYISLIPVIVEALKEQESKNSSKDSVIESLDKKIITLQRTITSQEQSIIKLQNQIEDIKKNCCGSKTKSAVADEIQNTGITLYQNTPNPFTQTTEIKYSLPETVVNASLYIFNMQGTMIKSISISTRGNGSVTINGSELKPGMYLYSLVADGEEADTKRMILTN